MSHRFSWVLALLVIVVSGALMALIGDDASSQQSPVPVPTSAESARADALRAQFPGGDRVPAIVVVSRRDGDATQPGRPRRSAAGSAQLSDDRSSPRWPWYRWTPNLSGFALNDAVKSLRDAATRGVPPRPARRGHRRTGVRSGHRELVLRGQHHAAGGDGFRRRAAADRHLPLAGAVAGAARGDRVRRSGRRCHRSALAEAVGMQPDGSTSGITSVLVFGAGTNYALLLISRYREELGRTDIRGPHWTWRCGGPDPRSSRATRPLSLP